MIKWHILGAGAIGSLLSYRMLEKKIPCALLHHHEGSREQVLIDGRRTTRLAVQALSTTAPEGIKHLLVTTKATQLNHAITLAVPYLSGDAVIVCTANGLGFEQAVKKAHPKLALYRAVSTAGAFRDQENAVHLVSNGKTRVGLPKARAKPPKWFSTSLSGLEGWTWETGIDQAIGEKFSINCVINALTASQQCRNGELLDGEQAGLELTALCRESEGPLKILGLWPEERDLLRTATAVCRETAQNMSSMLQDRIAGRATEIDFLNGELVRRGSAIGLSLPLNQKLLKLLQ